MAILIEIGSLDERSFDVGELTTLGREIGNRVQLADPSVSRRHAELRRTEDGHYRVVDLGSAYGTFVAGRRITEAVLSDGDEIRLGGARLRFVDRTVDIAAVDEMAIVAEAPTEVTHRLPVPGDRHFPPEKTVTTENELRRDYEKLRAAYQLGRAIGVDVDLDSILTRILDTAFQLLPADRGAIFLVEPDTGRPTLRVARWRSCERTKMVFSRTVIQEAIGRRAGVLSADAGIDDRFNRSGSVMHEGVRSTMCVPMLHRGELLGVMLLDSLVATNAFVEKDLELFTSIASEAALAIKNTLLRQHITEVTALERRRLDRVIRDLPTGVILLDSAHRIVMANRRAQEFLPLLTSATEGEALSRLGPLSLDDLLAAPAGGSVEIVIAGLPRRVFTASIEHSTEGPGESELVIALQDVTRERESEERSSRGERMALVGQLAGGIAHDFNNLMSVILVYGDLLAGELKGTPFATDLEPICDAAERAVDLTRQLLDFGRQQLVQARVVDFNKAIESTVKMTRRTLGAHILLKTELAPSLSPVIADPGKLEQVLLNLIVNARDAMPSGGTITIATSNLALDEPRSHGAGGVLPRGRHVLVEVADIGCGMAPEVAARIFEPFFTTKDVGKGTGLGLATVYGIVQQAGGHIWVESAPGVGTTFRICYPATDETRIEELPSGTPLVSAVDCHVSQFAEAV